ncbi:YdeI/OmpD-associated family protein [Agromyces silvae]|uniref:YdeI/OmpD-associated family protein n=1 Tax=Agromyces silvae TaxID=3388266 RepID=UPI00280AE8B4|nr:YdeI/OmpD-associated family protein [Agromyces protaetiae]
MVSFADKPLLGPLTVEEWETFLADDPPEGGVRLVLRKKTSSAPGIAYAEALDVALCFGWIDGQVARVDDDYVAQAFTPRRSRSPWSQINREHVQRLIDAGRMRPQGHAEIERAKADGRWDEAYRMSTAEPEPDFQAALDANPEASAFWATLSRSKRWPFLFRVMGAKRPETRARRIQQFIEMLANHETF